jgi:hypothetical protein
MTREGYGTHPVLEAPTIDTVSEAVDTVSEAVTAALSISSETPSGHGHEIRRLQKKLAKVKHQHSELLGWTTNVNYASRAPAHVQRKDESRLGTLEEAMSSAAAYVVETYGVGGSVASGVAGGGAGGEGGRKRGGAAAMPVWQDGNLTGFQASGKGDYSCCYCQLKLVMDEMLFPVETSPKETNWAVGFPAPCACWLSASLLK